MPPTSSLYRSVDQYLDGKLGEILAELRSSNCSFDAMVRELAVKHEVTVSKQTIATWCAQLGLVKSAS